MVTCEAVDPRAAWARKVGFLALSGLLVWAVLVVRYIPTNDGPEHVLMSHIDNHYADPGTPYADRLRPALDFAARGFAFIYTPLEAWLGWRVGLSAAMVVMVLANAVGFGCLVRAANPGRWPVAFLGFPLALTWELYMGFFAFTVGSAVGLFVLAVALTWTADSRGPLRWGVLASLLFFQAVCHVFTAVLTGIVLAALLIVRAASIGSDADHSREARGRRVLREALRVVMVGLPAFAILIAAVVSGRSQADRPFAHATLFQPFSMTLLELPRLLVPGPNGRALPAMVLVGAAVVIGLRSMARTQLSSTDGALLAAGSLFLLAGTCAPLDIPGWQYFSPRFLPLGVVLCLATLPVERLRLPVAVTLFPWVTFAVAGGSLIASAALHRRLAGAVDDAYAGLSAPVERHSLWLPIGLPSQTAMSLDPTVSEVPFLVPLEHIAALYAVVEGGLSPYSVATNAANTPFIVREDGPKAPPTPSMEKFTPILVSDRFRSDLVFRDRVLDELATYGMFYEGILVTGMTASDRALFRDRGFAADAERGTVLIAHFVACTLDLAFPGAGEAPLIDVGVGGQTILRDAARGGKSVASAGASDGKRHVFVPSAPCGTIWVRAYNKEKPDAGRVSRVFCESAPTGGTLTKPSSVACTLDVAELKTE